MSSIDLVLERVGHCEWRNGYYMASCPAHEDRKPSLSITQGEDGKVLLHCFAGCEKAKILAALGLDAGDLFPARPTAPGMGTRRRAESLPPPGRFGMPGASFRLSTSASTATAAKTACGSYPAQADGG